MTFRYAALAAAFTMLASTAAFAADADNGFAADAGVKIGQKTLHKNDWSGGGIDLTNQMGFGLMTSGGMKSWPVMVALDIDYTSGSKSSGGVKVSGSTMEIALGARKGFVLQGLPIMPYAGLGVSYGQGTVKVTGFSSTTLTGYGLWMDGGAQYMLGKLGVGLDIRYDGCPVSKKQNGFTSKSDVGGFFPSLTVGYGF